MLPSVPPCYISPVIIAIDYNAALRQIAGIGRYAREMVRSFAALASGDELVLFYAARDLDPASDALRQLRELQATYPAIRTVALPFTERHLTIIWQRLRLPLAVERWTGAVDWVHAPDFVLPPVQQARSLVTVHDLTFRVHPETAHPRLKRYLDTAVPRSLARATHIIAVSESTKRDIVELLGVAADKITVIPHGLSPQFKRVIDQAELERVRARYDLSATFFLHVGTIEPRKNLVRLIDAFTGLRIPPDQPQPELLLAGKQGWLAEPILARAQAAPHVRLLGPVADADLPALYTLAACVVYPSFYEGFGFPAMEALACGTPVVAANTSSLPELVGDVGLLIDPQNTDALQTAMQQVLDDPQHTVRARSAGPRHTAPYTWERAARQLLDVYRMTGTR